MNEKNSSFLHSLFPPALLSVVLLQDDRSTACLRAHCVSCVPVTQAWEGQGRECAAGREKQPRAVSSCPLRSMPGACTTHPMIAVGRCRKRKDVRLRRDKRRKSLRPRAQYSQYCNISASHYPNWFFRNMANWRLWRAHQTSHTTGRVR